MTKSSTQIVDTTASPEWEIQLFHDGDCPLCRREVSMLKRLDSEGKIDFVDIADPDFNVNTCGKEREALMREIHARLRDGRWITGVEVFRRVYSVVGFKALVAVSRLPGVKHALNLGYRIFAKNRLKLTGRCSRADSACRVSSQKQVSTAGRQPVRRPQASTS